MISCETFNALRRTRMRLKRKKGDFLLNLVWTSQSSTKLLQAWNCMTPIPSLTAEQLQGSILADSKTARPALKISLEEQSIYIYVDTHSEQVCRLKGSLLAEHWFRNSSCLKGNCSFHPCQPLWTQPCTTFELTTSQPFLFNRLMMTSTRCKTWVH